MSHFSLHLHLSHPRQFSEDVVNQLVDHQASPEIPRERQLTIDAHIRSRIDSEISRLHNEEERVREEIERALEKENLDRERGMAGEEAASDEASPAGSIKSSAALMGDLEELRQKVDKYHARRDSEELATVRAKGEEVVLCYKSVSSRLLFPFPILTLKKITSIDYFGLLESRRRIQSLGCAGRAGPSVSARLQSLPHNSTPHAAICQLATVVIDLQ